MYHFESTEQLKVFIASEVINTSEATLLLGCTRQNLNLMVKAGRIVPVKQLAKETLFLRSEILSRVEKQSKPAKL